VSTSTVESAKSGLSRRRVITAGAAASGALIGSALAGAPASPASVTDSVPTAPTGARILRPRRLRPGDRVRVVSPGSTPQRANVARGVEILESWGLVVEIAPHVFDQYGYLAGRDEDRLADLNDALADPTIRGVFASRGGYGTQRIVDAVNINAVRRDPKVVVGFSDITSLQNKLWRDTRLATIHGPMVNWSDSRTGPESAEALRAAVMTTSQIVIQREETESTASIVVPGRAEGILLGGNLTMLDSSVAAGDFPDLTGAILFIEEVGEAPYRIDRMLSHLRRIGALDGIVGVALGQVTDSEGDNWTFVDTLRDRLCDLGVPVLGGLRLGHGNGQLTIPLGVPAVLDADAGVLIAEPAVRD